MTFIAHFLPDRWFADAGCNGHRGSTLKRWAVATLVGAWLWGPALLLADAGNYAIESFGAAPQTPTGELDARVRDAVDSIFIDSVRNREWGKSQDRALEIMVESGDPRLAWPLSDLMRFIHHPALESTLARAATHLLGLPEVDHNRWGTITNHLMAWDIPAPPDYLQLKRAMFTTIVPGWDRLFVEGAIDWRHVSWGGVLIDDRPYDTTDEDCNCIPAVDNPAVTGVPEAEWLNDNDIVFGVVVNGEARAYPRRIMEVREMVNDTLGGRHIAIPYCTLCASAQAYYTDRLPEGVERPVLRTSGLLIRSNKVMYDINSYSLFDTFLGHAVTGPLAEKGIRLEQTSVVTTEWGQWKTAYPETTVLEESLAMGRDFDFRNTRDAGGPIFPIGDVDPRLSVHEDVVGVIGDAGEAVAFQRSKAQAALLGGETVEFRGIRLILDGGGIRAVNEQGEDLVSHQAFWFAWSQFHPRTGLWPPAR